MVGYEGVATLIDQARYCEEENIPGAFVEIGTHKGGCLGAMAHANLVFGRAEKFTASIVLKAFLSRALTRTIWGGQSTRCD